MNTPVFADQQELNIHQLCADAMCRLENLTRAPFCRLGLYNTPAVPLQRGKTPTPNESPGYDTKLFYDKH